MVVTRMDFEEFFAGETDDFAPFQTPGELESPSPTLGWLGILEYTPDDASLRLRQFAYEMTYFARDHAVVELGWDSDPDRAAQGALLRRASESQADGGLAAEDFELLWRISPRCGRTDSAREWSHGTPVRWPGSRTNFAAA